MSDEKESKVLTSFVRIPFDWMALNQLDMKIGRDDSSIMPQSDEKRGRSLTPIQFHSLN